jgi:hypothetical protein
MSSQDKANDDLASRVKKILTRKKEKERIYTITSNFQKDRQFDREMLEKLKYEMAGRESQFQATQKLPKQFVTTGNHSDNDTEGLKALLQNEVHNRLKPYEYDGWDGEVRHEYDLARLANKYDVRLRCRTCASSIGNTLILDERQAHDQRWVFHAVRKVAYEIADGVRRHRVGCKASHAADSKEYFTGAFKETEVIPQEKKPAVEEKKEDDIYPEWDY